MAERTVILYTFSKKFAMTGWRLGAAVGPAKFIEYISKINVNDESCSNHFIQYGALAGLQGSNEGPLGILSVLKERRDVLVDLLNAIPGICCFKPEATFYLFPNVTGAMKRKGIADVEDFASWFSRKRGELLHEETLRPTSAGRDRAVYKVRLFGDRRAPDQGGNEEAGEFLA